MEEQNKRMMTIEYKSLTRGKYKEVKRSNEYGTCLVAGGGTADECPARRTMIRCTALRAARGAIKLSDILQKYSSTTIHQRFL